ncbi:MAG: Crp/Fnr family transcriptional regulator [Hyphomonadaceae bacterium]
MCIAGGTLDKMGKTASDDWSMTTGGRLPAIDIPAHSHIFFEGDERRTLYLVESGWVKLYRTLIDGQRQVVGFANAGSVLGLESDGEHVNSCEAITPVKVRTIPIARLPEMFARDPIFSEQILRQVGRQLGAAQAQLAAVGVQSAEQKLATFLLSVSRLCDACEYGEFDLPMRRGDMAEFLGLRLETVSRKMSEFQRRGWIRMTSLYNCQLVNREALEDLAEGAEILPPAIRQAG